MSDPPDELEQRLIDLEIRYTHQQSEVEQLSDVVYEQRKVIEALTARVERLERLDAEAGDDAESEE